MSGTTNNTAIRDTQNAIRLKAEIHKETVCVMFGIELRRLRTAKNLSQQGLADKMNSWNWYRKKVVRFEDAFEFRLHPDVMADLLKCLNASSI